MNFKHFLNYGFAIECADKLVFILSLSIVYHVMCIALTCPFPFPFALYTVNCVYFVHFSCPSTPCK